MPVKKLMDFLDENQVKYITIAHSMAYTAQEVAASAHVPGREMAKTVICKLDGEMGMAVLRAQDKVDMDQLCLATGAEDVELASEAEFRDRFPGCEPGAMPPFGNLYGMRVYLEEGLCVDEQIAFNAGTHTELVRLSYMDFQRLVEPRIANFSL
ncbi:MAG: deacylase [Gammaproteobacteria bacterium]|nr:MAG: deacylase [Gammaproteobacteria bacterium]